MLLSSTSSFGTVAALAATCLAGAGNAVADEAPSWAWSPGNQHQHWPLSATFGPTGLERRVVVAYEHKAEKSGGLHNQVSQARETTEQEHLIANLRRMEKIPAGWDGEGATAPEITSLRAAGQFACLLPTNIEMPEPLIHATGKAALAWNGVDHYGEIEFLSDTAAAYYFVRGKDKHKGVVTLDSRSIPPALTPLLPG